MNYQRGFILPALPNPYLLVAAGVALIVSFSFGYMKGLSNGLNQLADYKAEVSAAQAEAAAENAAQLAAARKDTADVADAYAAVVGRIVSERNSRLIGLRREASSCATATLVASSSRVANAAAADSGPSSGTLEAACERLESDCTRTTTQVIWLQDWVRRVCK